MKSPAGPALLVARPPRGDAPIALSIVIPAFDEAYRLPALLEALRHNVDVATTELIIVDDGSRDGTATVGRRAADWAEHLLVIGHETNRGKGAAVRTGVAAARGDVIGFVDADNATDLAALEPMIAALGAGVGAVFGSRHAPGSQVTGSPAIRGIMGRVFNHLVKFAAGTSIRDTQCGAKVFRGPAARVAFATSTVDGFAFDVDVLRRVLTMGFEVLEYPVRWHYVHGTKIRFTSPARMLLDIGRVRMARSTGPYHYVDCPWVDSLADVTDPLDPGTRPALGEPCRIIIAFGAAAAGSPVATPGAAAPDGEITARLDTAAVPYSRSQSRTWLQLTGTSES